MRERTLSVNIPAGVEDGTKIRLAGVPFRVPERTEKLIIPSSSCATSSSAIRK